MQRKAQGSVTFRKLWQTDRSNHPTDQQINQMTDIRGHREIMHPITFKIFMFGSYTFNNIDANTSVNLSCKIQINYRMFIKYSVFSKILKYVPDSLGVIVCTQWQVKHHHCSRTDRVTIFNQHPEEIREMTFEKRYFRQFFFYN